MHHGSHELHHPRAHAAVRCVSGAGDHSKSVIQLGRARAKLEFAKMTLFEERLTKEWEMIQGDVGYENKLRERQEKEEAMAENEATGFKTRRQFIQDAKSLIRHMVKISEYEDDKSGVVVPMEGMELWAAQRLTPPANPFASDWNPVNTDSDSSSESDSGHESDWKEDHSNDGGSVSDVGHAWLFFADHESDISSSGLGLEVTQEDMEI